MLGFQSCIDLEEDTSSILQTDKLHDEGNITAALAALYRSYLNSIQYPNHHYLTSLGADDVTTWWAGGRASLRTFDRFSYGEGQNSDNPWLLRKWQKHWQVIQGANHLIEGLKGAKVSTKTAQKAEAEARFFRALSYYDLVRAFGNVPLVVKPEITSQLENRTSVLENYLFIETDLQFAEEHLRGPGETGAVGRVSSAAAKAVLADLYLSWGGWPLKDESKFEGAAEKAKEVIDFNYFELLPIDQLWLEDKGNSRESVFSVQFSQTEELHSAYPSQFSFHESRGWSDFYPERQFYYDFPEGPRKEITFYSEIPQRGYDPLEGEIYDKEPATKHWTESQRNHPMYKKYNLSATHTAWRRVASFRPFEIIRYAEVLLIYAEARSQENASYLSLDAPVTGDALEALNQVRRRAAGLDYLIPNVTADLAAASTQNVLDERGWELAGENKRWYDLVRTEQLREAVLRRDPTEEVQLVLQASEITWKQYIAPIPYEYAGNEGNLEQNPSGFKMY